MVVARAGRVSGAAPAAVLAQPAAPARPHADASRSRRTAPRRSTSCCRLAASACRPARPSCGRARLRGGRRSACATTVAEVTPILSGLRSVGNWRELYPGDEVELWLDEEHLVPLELTVRPAAEAGARRWEAERGYHDRPGTALLEVSLSDVEVNGRLPGDSFPAVPKDAPQSRRRLRRAPVDPPLVPVPSHVPAGMRAYRAASSPTGAPRRRAHVDRRAVLGEGAGRRGLGGGTLFGELGDVVRPVELAGAGVAYVGERGDRSRVHGDAIDVVGRRKRGRGRASRGGRLPRRARAAGAAAWAEAGTGTLAEAEAALPGLLVVSRLDGFRPPGVRIEDRVVTLDYAGAGARGFRLTEALGRPARATARSRRSRRGGARHRSGATSRRPASSSGWRRAWSSACAAPRSRSPSSSASPTHWCADDVTAARRGSRRGGRGASRGVGIAGSCSAPRAWPPSRRPERTPSSLRPVSPVPVGPTRRRRCPSRAIGCCSCGRRARLPAGMAEPRHRRRRASSGSRPSTAGWSR